MAADLGFEYTTVSADIDEKAFRNEDPAELVATLALEKANAILRQWLEDDSFPDEGGAWICTTSSRTTMQECRQMKGRQA